MSTGCFQLHTMHKGGLNSKHVVLSPIVRNPKVGGPLVSLASQQCQWKVRLLPSSSSAVLSLLAAVPAHDHSKMKPHVLTGQLSKRRGRAFLLISLCSQGRQSF